MLLFIGLVLIGAIQTSNADLSISSLESDKYLILDSHLDIGNFGGFPSITLPSGFIDGMPVGINITGRVKEDDVVLNIANKIEETMEYKNQVARGDKNV